MLADCWLPIASVGTTEMYFSAKRQQYLVDQGYTFKVVADLVDLANATEGSCLKDKTAELDLLATVLSSDTDKVCDLSRCEPRALLRCLKCYLSQLATCIHGPCSTTPCLALTCHVGEHDVTRC